ncbi:MAG TPA: helix-hairpin-helix domain-containing protein [Kineosporiaceae bacterium]
MEELVVWFAVQSLPMLVLAFLLGVLVGWMWWRRRKVQFTESDALAAVAARHEVTLASMRQELDRGRHAVTEKDVEIARLSTLVSGDTLELAALHERELSLKDEQIAELRGQLQVRDTQLGVRAVELGTRDAEIDRLAALVEKAEALATTHANEIASLDGRLADHAAELGDRDAEIARLSAALHAAVTGADRGAVAGADRAAVAGAGGRAADGVTLEPTDPRPEQVAPFLAAVESTGAIPGDEPVDAGQAAPSGTDGTPDLYPPEPDPADDLERVEGIGPRIGIALRDAGIVTFRQLAQADIATLQAALEQAGLRFAPSLPTWSRQAELLANGDEAAFTALAEALVTGRDASGGK